MRALSFTPIWLVVLSLLPALSAAAPTECKNLGRIGHYAGHYARKEIWDLLPKLRHWWKANRIDGSISAVDIARDGETTASFNWHEGGSVCVRFHGKELWAKNAYTSSTKWEGPFIRIASDDAAKIDNAYFARLFGKKCYASNVGENWCFGDGSIGIDGRMYRAKLEFDTTELPSYGSVISADGEKDFWVFVPQRNGWKVFRDTLVTDGEREEIDPNKSLPWRALIPQ